MNTNSVEFFKNISPEVNPGESQLIIVAWKLKTPGNMGQIIRLAHNVGALKVIFVDNGIKKRTSEIKKTAGFSFDQMDWEIIDESNFDASLPPGFIRVSIETSDGAENIYTVKLPQKTVLIVGSESKGLPEEIVNASHQNAYIPMPGGCKSLNVSHAISVAAFEWLRQTAFQ